MAAKNVKDEQWDLVPTKESQQTKASLVNAG